MKVFDMTNVSKSLDVQFPKEEQSQPAEAKYSEDEIAIGIKVEREHADTIAEMRSKIEGGGGLSDDDIIQMIVMDHLSENPTYYSDMKAAGLEKSDVVDLTEINKDEWWKGVKESEGAKRPLTEDRPPRSKDHAKLLRAAEHVVRTEHLTDPKSKTGYLSERKKKHIMEDISHAHGIDPKDVEDKIQNMTNNQFDRARNEGLYADFDYDETKHPRDQFGRWTNKDDGQWPAESYQQAFDGLGGDEDAVVSNLADDVDDAPQFAKWLQYMSKGGMSNKENAGIEFDVDDEQMLAVLRDVLSKKGIDIPHPATRQASPGEGEDATWKQPPVELPKKKDTGDYMLMTGPGALMLGKEYVLKDAKIDFSFACDITKAEKTAEGKLLIHGVASDTREDKDGEEMSDNAMKDMLDCIKSGNVVILPNHKAEWDEEMGRVVDGKLEDGALHITAELDPDNDKAQKLMKALSLGKQIGLSIGGTVKKVFNKAAGMLGKFRKVIDGLELKHIAVTGRPANPRTWISAIAKSIDEEVVRYAGQNQQGR